MYKVKKISSRERSFSGGGMYWENGVKNCFVVVISRQRVPQNSPLIPNVSTENTGSRMNRSSHQRTQAKSNDNALIPGDWDFQIIFPNLVIGKSAPVEKWLL